MPMFLDTRGNSTLGVGVCGRCSKKLPLDQLYSDPNAVGLKVCLKDLDDFDPYKLPARQPDQISLPFVRPDVSIATSPLGVIQESGDLFLISEDGNFYLYP